MSRRLRLIVAGAPLHITQRGVDRCITFRAPEDFAVYLWALGEGSVATHCAVHAYALMTNHVHLLLTPSDASGPVRLMQWLGRCYVRYFNNRYHRTGPLWEGRYRSTVIDSDRYFLACSRYIERNPQRARLVDDPGAYDWSSFRHNACGELNPILTPHPLRTSLGADEAERCVAYRRLFDADLPLTAVPAVRTAPLAPCSLPTRGTAGDGIRRRAVDRPGRRITHLERLMPA
jgi:putative transposase